MCFFELYGNKFDNFKTAITVLNGGSYLERERPEGFLDFPPLYMIDPSNTAKNAARDCFRIVQVKRVFKKAFYHLSEMLVKRNKKGSILSGIISILEKVNEYCSWADSTWSLPPLAFGPPPPDYYVLPHHSYSGSNSFHLSPRQPRAFAPPTASTWSLTPDFSLSNAPHHSGHTLPFSTPQAFASPSITATRPLTPLASGYTQPNYPYSSGGYNFPVSSPSHQPQAFSNPLTTTTTTTTWSLSPLASSHMRPCHPYSRATLLPLPQLQALSPPTTTVSASSSPTK